jgi:hypothetical protein
MRLVREVKRIGDENLNKRKVFQWQAVCRVYSVQYALEHNDWRD